MHNDSYLGALLGWKDLSLPLARGVCVPHCRPLPMEYKLLDLEHPLSLWSLSSGWAGLTSLWAKSSLCHTLRTVAEGLVNFRKRVQCAYFVGRVLYRVNYHGGDLQSADFPGRFLCPWTWGGEAADLHLSRAWLDCVWSGFMFESRAHPAGVMETEKQVLNNCPLILYLIVNAWTVLLSGLW